LGWSLTNDAVPLVRLRGIARSAAIAQRIRAARTDQRWIPAEEVDALGAARPSSRLAEGVATAGCGPSLSAIEQAGVGFAGTDLHALIAGANEEITVAELVSRRSFFDTIGKTPLTEEQARAVVCFDNRVQVLAGAGSGKTSVMVARAAYAVERGFVAPDRILLLAFNKVAAAELQERVTARFAAAGIDSTGVRASTFHAFGLHLIGHAAGEKPRLAAWLDQGQDVDMVLHIADELRERPGPFRYHWDLYRLVFAHAPTELDQHEPDAFEGTQTGYRTLAGEIVRSHSERLIADFLFLNGVRYVYEQPYAVNVADPGHGQYRPDFYYPDIDVWHEHWAIGRDGKPPAAFVGYAASMAWKRQLHAHYRTTLVESTWADVVFGDGLSKLEQELTRLGLNFDWNPDRPAQHPWAKPMQHEELAKIVRTFLVHVKSNGWTAQTLDERLSTQLVRLNGFRTRLFLSIFGPVYAEWERRLAANGSVDFEDMLGQAADHLEAGRVESPYDLVMVDDFRDASRARARLVRGLAEQAQPLPPGRRRRLAGHQPLR
jgi:DNA helicase-4